MCVLCTLAPCEWYILEWIGQHMGEVSMEEWPWDTGFVRHRPDQAWAICAFAFLRTGQIYTAPAQGRALVTFSLLIFILSFSSHHPHPCHH